MFFQLLHSTTASKPELSEQTVSNHRFQKKKTVAVQPVSCLHGNKTSTLSTLSTLHFRLTLSDSDKRDILQQQTT